MEKVVYIADLREDIDDFIAALYLHKKGLLQEVVYDPDNADVNWLNVLMYQGITVRYYIPTPGSKYFICGGGLSKTYDFLKSEKESIDTFVMNGGFVGCNVVKPEDELKKFKNKQFVRTYNFNLNAKTTNKFLRLPENKLKNMVLVGKNVCHSELNTVKYLWKDDPIIKEIRQTYEVPADKRLHDLLAVHEALAILDPTNYKPYCKYEELYPCTENGIEAEMTKWGSSKTRTLNGKRIPYRKCKVATGFIDSLFL